jgi:hypothetical protein
MRRRQLGKRGREDTLEDALEDALDASATAAGKRGGRDVRIRTENRSLIELPILVPVGEYPMSSLCRTLVQFPICSFMLSSTGGLEHSTNKLRDNGGKEFEKRRLTQGFGIVGSDGAAIIIIRWLY